MLIKQVCACFFLISLVFVISGCVAAGTFEANVKIFDKGVATGEFPGGMVAGNLWAEAGDGYLRFKHREMWEAAEIGKFFVIRFNHQGWVLSLLPSTVEKDLLISIDQSSHPFKRFVPREVPPTTKDP